MQFGIAPNLNNTPLYFKFDETTRVRLKCNTTYTTFISRNMMKK